MVIIRYQGYVMDIYTASYIQFLICTILSLIIENNNKNVGKIFL